MRYTVPSLAIAFVFVLAIQAPAVAAAPPVAGVTATQGTAYKVRLVKPDGGLVFDAAMTVVRRMPAAAYVYHEYTYVKSSTAHTSQKGSVDVGTSVDINPCAAKGAVAPDADCVSIDLSHSDLLSMRTFTAPGLPAIQLPQVSEWHLAQQVEIAPGGCIEFPLSDGADHEGKLTIQRGVEGTKEFSVCHPRIAAAVSLRPVVKAAYAAHVGDGVARGSGVLQ